MTKKSMYFKIIFNSLIRRRSRMFIALLSITIGAIIMSGLITIYFDIPRQLGKEFRSYGANLVLIPSEETDEKISSEDFEKLKKILPSGKVVGLAPYRYQTTKINEQPYMLAGTDLEEAKKNSPFWHIDGEWLTNSDKDKAMIGKEIARTLNLHIGDSFTVQGVKYGQTSKSSNLSNTAEENKDRQLGEEYYEKTLYVESIVTTGGAEESFIFINIDSLNSIIQDKTRIDVIEGSIEADSLELNELSKEINSKIPSLIGRPVKRITESQDTVLTKLQALVYLVNIIILLLTIISVSTTMMTVVSERKQEIGLKKALGAKNGSIVMEFLGEGILLGALGGLLGVILGFFFAQKVSLSVFGRVITFQWLLVPFTVICFVIITIIACLIPVRNTIYVDPAVVLRGE